MLNVRAAATRCQLSAAERSGRADTSSEPSVGSVRTKATHVICSVGVREGVEHRGAGMMGGGGVSVYLCQHDVRDEEGGRGEGRERACVLWLMVGSHPIGGGQGVMSGWWLMVQAGRVQRGGGARGVQCQKQWKETRLVCVGGVLVLVCNGGGGEEEGGRCGSRTEPEPPSVLATQRRDA